MAVLNEYVSDNTFSVDYYHSDLYAVSFVWEGNFITVLWNCVLEEVVFTLPEYETDFAELSSYIKNKLNY